MVVAASVAMLGAGHAAADDDDLDARDEATRAACE